MRPRLDRWGADTHSQFGEDGCVAHILEQIGERHRVAVEFGAADGLTCSNTAALWQAGWTGILIEADHARFEELERNTAPHETICLRKHVEPTGPHSIAHLLNEHDVHGVDYMSIDVDGDDYLIFEALACRPRVVSVEYNPTVPPHLEIYPKEPGSTFGASLLALERLGTRIGYRLVGATYCNAFFVDADEAAPFHEYVADVVELCADRAYTYAVTDFAGRVVLCGESLPWGAHEPYVAPLGLGDGIVVTYQEGEGQDRLRAGVEREWGATMMFRPSALAASTVQASHDKLRALLISVHPPVVCVDLTNDQPGDEDWMVQIAADCEYRPVYAGRVLSLIRT